MTHALDTPARWAPAKLRSLGRWHVALSLVGLSLLGLAAAVGAQPPGDSAGVALKMGGADTLGAVPAPALSKPPVEPAPGATPLMVLAQIEEGWRAGAPEVVVGCLASEGIQIECEHAGPPPGRFARPQAEFLIRDLLHYGDTLDFRLTRFEWKNEGAKGQAVWLHRMGNAERKLYVEIELAQTAGNWRVVRLASH